MYPTTLLSGQESGSELMNIRRDRVRERRIRKASIITGTILPVVSAPSAEIIEFPAPEYPRIA